MDVVGIMPSDGRPVLSAYEYAAAGAIAGAVEVTIQQPEIAWKNAIQDKRPIEFHPKFFYRGLTINIASMAPYTAVQFAFNGMLSKWLSKGMRLVIMEKHHSNQRKQGVRNLWETGKNLELRLLLVV